ncbi:pancreatic secretory granule membrane major glycoprotein GP2 [Lates calcarifer]|uniref:Pancreatic secretory granule membrane major glycoprotein GP2 n=1 Tax=Lates calcarifer TaxID=8187 RepID=A0AAJ7LGS3_LATCA|nr:pancreatic secretory granule membrane major glycoprotein GP2 [Lates calcarifer]
MVVPEVITFSCAYPLETNTSLDAVIRPPFHRDALSGSGDKATAHMYLFRDSSYLGIYPAGEVTLPVGSTLHVGVFVDESDQSFAVVLEDCFTTHSSNPDDPMQHLLIHSGCPIDPRRVSVVENGLSLRALFSAMLHPLQGDNPYSFLHCRLSLCNKRSNNCVPFCRGRARRFVPRFVPHFAQLDPLTIGPITWEK